MIPGRYNEEIKTAYWSDRPDRRKQALFLVRHIRFLIVGLILGTILGMIIYIAYRNATEGTMYEAKSEFYIDFTLGEDGKAAYDYYNGYTWNDLMTTDPIAGFTLEALEGKGVDLTQLEESTEATILSDIRVLIVTIRNSDEELCSEIQQATEYALGSFGRDHKEFEAITVIKSEAPEMVFADDRMPQAALLGLIVGGLLSVIAIWFAFVLDDLIALPSDAEGLGPEFLGVEFSDEDKELSSRINAIFGERASVDPESGETEEECHFDASYFQDTDSRIPSIDPGKKVIIDVPYRHVTRSALRLLIDRMNAGNVEISGIMITGADTRFYRSYYGFGNNEKR